MLGIVERSAADAVEQIFVTVIGFYVKNTVLDFTVKLCQKLSAGFGFKAEIKGGVISFYFYHDVFISFFFTFFSTPEAALRLLLCGILRAKFVDGFFSS